ncbi:uncharacterized protein LOC124992303 [Sciurus carolinensis]|uniref:uncharacterized protein LOC124992303 n=1 Tax=Sciurus carolinensis TaxID=30640 RepID=UPI001FB55BC7|nr:uncharacterized protein LOC124992303 [Sciurus carolinensis]
MRAEDQQQKGRSPRGRCVRRRRQRDRRAQRTPCRWEATVERPHRGTAGTVGQQGPWDSGDCGTAGTTGTRPQCSQEGLFSWPWNCSPSVKAKKRCQEPPKSSLQGAWPSTQHLLSNDRETQSSAPEPTTRPGARRGGEEAGGVCSGGVLPRESLCRGRPPCPSTQVEGRAAEEEQPSPLVAEVTHHTAPGSCWSALVPDTELAWGNLRGQLQERGVKSGSSGRAVSPSRADQGYQEDATPRAMVKDALPKKPGCWMRRPWRSWFLGGKLLVWERRVGCWGQAGLAPPQELPRPLASPPSLPWPPGGGRGSRVRAGVEQGAGKRGELADCPSCPPCC